jgi:hypothetical protein
MMGHIWWAIFGYGVGKLVDAYIEFEPPDGFNNGAGGGGISSVCNYIPGIGVRCH